MLMKWEEFMNFVEIKGGICNMHHCLRASYGLLGIWTPLAIIGYRGSAEDIQ